MDSQYKLLSELLSDQAAFITSPEASLENYYYYIRIKIYNNYEQITRRCHGEHGKLLGGIAPCPPVSTGLRFVLYW